MHANAKYPVTLFVSALEMKVPNKLFLKKPVEPQNIDGENVDNKKNIRKCPLLLIFAQPRKNWRQYEQEVKVGQNWKAGIQVELGR